MTTPEHPSLPPALDVLGAPEPAGRGGRSGPLLIGLVGAGALAVAGAAVAVASFLGGGGTQPEEVLPRTSMAMVKLDLDPAAGQKLAIYRLGKRFPSLSDDLRDADKIKDELLSALLDDVEEVEYERDIRPWIGDRVALAMVPGAEEPEPLAAVAFTDRAKAEEGLKKLQQNDDEMFFGFSEKADYVLVGSSQSTVDAALAPEQVLADSESWDKGMDALDGDQIVTAWGDLAAIWAALPAEARDAAGQAYGIEAGVDVTGTLVAGLRAADEHLELVGKGIDLESSLGLTSLVGAEKGSGLVQGLPADTVAALSVTGLGAGLAEAFETGLGDDDPLGLLQSAEGLGLSLPDDLRVLLGNETVLAAFGESDFAARSRTDEVDAAHDAAQAIASLVSGGGDTSQVLRRLEDGIAVASSPRALEAISTNGGGLGDSAAFRKAVPDATDAGFLAYVDVARVVELAGQDLGEHAADVAQLQSVGITATSDGRNSTLRLRLTVRD